MLVERAIKPSYKRDIIPKWNDLRQLVIRLPSKVKDFDDNDVRVTLMNVNEIIDMTRIHSQ